MDISLSVLLFYGGIAGAVLFVLAGIVCWLVLRKKGRKLRESIDKEYE